MNEQGDPRPPISMSAALPLGPTDPLVALLNEAVASLAEVEPLRQRLLEIMRSDGEPDPVFQQQYAECRHRVSMARLAAGRSLWMLRSLCDRERWERALDTIGITPFRAIDLLCVYLAANGISPSVWEGGGE